MRIQVNEGADNEFEYMGGDGFTFITYKYTVPVVGGITKNSIYYKSIKRQLGLLETGDVVDVEFKNAGDRETDLFFATRADGGALTEHFRIASDGYGEYEAARNDIIRFTGANSGEITFRKMWGFKKLEEKVFIN